VNRGDADRDGAVCPFRFHCSHAIHIRPAAVSDYTVLRAASETLRVLLKDNITDSSEADLMGVPVELRSPEQLHEDNITKAVSVWLYRLALQPDMLNLPPRRLSDDTYVARSLPLELMYLITAIHPHAHTELALTGRALQVVDDYARVRGAQLRDTLAGSATELRLSIDTSSTTLGESAELWYSLRAPFRLSVPIRVQVVTIDTLVPPVVTPPVLSRTAGITELIGGAS
jgi:Pvc16 N-terminal domain